MFICKLYKGLVELSKMVRWHAIYVIAKTDCSSSQSGDVIQMHVVPVLTAVSSMMCPLRQQ